MHAMPVHLDASFVVDSTNAAGLTSLQAPGVQAVYMHTSTTPVAGSPNPISGNIVIRLQDNYQRLIAMQAMMQSPNSGSAVKIDNSALTAGQAYVITTLGNATAAKWQAIGVAPGITPAVGVTFIATSNGGAGNTLTSRVMAPASSGVFQIEIVGRPDLMIAPAPSANQGYGAEIILAVRDAAGALVAPTDGSRIKISMMLSNSSVVTGANSAT